MNDTLIRLMDIFIRAGVPPAGGMALLEDLIQEIDDISEDLPYGRLN